MLINPETLILNGPTRLHGFLADTVPELIMDAQTLRPIVVAVVGSMKFTATGHLEPESLLAAGAELREQLAAVNANISPFDSLNCLGKMAGYNDWDGFFESIAQDIEQSHIDAAGTKVTSIESRKLAAAAV